MENIKVTLAQLVPKLGDRKHNLNLILESIENASNEKSNIVIFPELFLSGYSIGEHVVSLAESLNGSCLTEIKNACKKHAVHAVIGMPEKGDDEQYYISSIVVNDQGKLIGTYRKTHLFDKEKQFFSSGEELIVVETSLGTIGLMICFEVEFPEIARTLKMMGADFIIIINANMSPYENHHRIYANSRAMENELPVIICNRLGKEGDLDFCGGSMVIDAFGKILLDMGKEKAVKTVELPVTSDTDPKLNYISRRRKSLYL